MKAYINKKKIVIACEIKGYKTSAKKIKRKERTLYKSINSNFFWQTESRKDHIAIRNHFNYIDGVLSNRTIIATAHNNADFQQITEYFVIARYRNTQEFSYVVDGTNLTTTSFLPIPIKPNEQSTVTKAVTGGDT